MSSNNQKVYKPLISSNNMTTDYLLYRMGAKKASNTKYFAF